MRSRYVIPLGALTPPDPYTRRNGPFLPTRRGRAKNRVWRYVNKSVSSVYNLRCYISWKALTRTREYKIRELTCNEYHRSDLPSFMDMLANGITISLMLTCGKLPSALHYNHPSPLTTLSDCLPNLQPNLLPFPEPVDGPAYGQVFGWIPTILPCFWAAHFLKKSPT